MRPLFREMPALTGVRALAAYMVFLRHYPIFSRINPTQTFLADLFNQFNTGVTFFFVLSGFLLAHLYYDSASLDRHFLSEFYRKRFARIYPVFFILTAATFLVYYFQSSNGNVAIHRMFWSASLLKGFSQETFFYGIVSSWSLTVEMCFYLLCPLIFVVMRRYGYFFQQIIFFLLLGLFMVRLGLQLHNNHFFNDEGFCLNSTFFGRSFEFFAGIGLALYLRQYQPSARKWPLFTSLAVLLLALIYLGMILLGYALQVPAAFETSWGVLVQNFILPIPFALFLFGLITEKSWLQSLLSGKLFQVLGKASYSFYLVHVCFIADFIWAGLHTGSHPLNVLIGFVLLNLVSIIIYYTIELPLHRHLSAGFFRQFVYFAKNLTLKAEFLLKHYILRRTQTG